MTTRRCARCSSGAPASPRPTPSSTPPPPRSPPHDAGADDRYDTALDRWLALGAADLDARVGEVWADLGLAARLLDQPTATLSGGEAARAGLAALLLARFDVFLLDEPTNDLDLDGLARLERWIARRVRRRLVLVSHDRTFLARTVTDVVEIDEFTHRATRFAGGWQAYLDERAAAERPPWERFEEYDTKRTGARRHAPSASGSGPAQGLVARRSKLGRDRQVHPPLRRSTRPSSSPAGRRAPSGRWSASRSSTSRASRGQLRLDDRRPPPAAATSSPAATGVVVERVTPSALHARTDRPARSAPANAWRSSAPTARGKTTLLDALLGTVEPTAGHAPARPRRRRRRDRAGARPARRRPQSLLRAFQDATGLDAADARTLLAKFGLVADHVTRPAASLSPGERTRASLALLMANGANCLVLDEPTNHLDLPAIEQLEQALDTFAGTVLLVTHDRSLLDRGLTLTRRVELADGRIV